MTGARGADTFAGTEKVPEHLRFDVDRLCEWVGDRLPGFHRPVSVEKFRGGQSNPTYRIGTRRGDYVLRRKPPGPLRPTAHAVDREFRVLKALENTDILIPRPHLYCEDTDVIGSEFYIVDAVEGVVHWNAELPEMTPDQRGGFYRDLMATLGRLHALDWRELGLEDFGKSSGYAERNLKRWYRIYSETKAVEIPDMDWAAEALQERLPDNEPICLVHGDYGNHNVIATTAPPRVAAVLDWEMSTIGNPLIDFAHAMRPWMEPPEPGTDRPTLANKNLAEMGIPTIEENIATYTGKSGLTWSNGQFYLAFVMFRYAAMIQGVLHRYKIGTAANRHFAHNQDRVVVLAARARKILSGDG